MTNVGKKNSTDLLVSMYYVHVCMYLSIYFNRYIKNLTHGWPIFIDTMWLQFLFYYLYI